MNENKNVVMQLATTRKFGELEIQVYENPAVGHSRAQDDFWMTREQIGTALEYGTPRKAIQAIHERNKERLAPLSCVLKMRTQVGNHTEERDFFVYNLRGVMEICRYSKQPKANAFIDFCWDVMVALMQGETVSLNSAELRRQARFDIMTQGIEELRQSQLQLNSQIADLEEKRRQDRAAIENMIGFTKAGLDKSDRIVSKNEIIISAIEQLKKQLAMTIQQPTYQNVSYTPRKAYTPKAQTSWKHDVLEMSKKIAKIENITQRIVLNSMYKTLEKELGWSAYEEREIYAKRNDISDIYSIPLIDIVEMANDNIRSIFYCRMKDRYENDLFDPEEAKRQTHGSNRNPPMIPADVIPSRHKIEDLPGSDDIKVVAEVQAVEVPVKKNYYKPSEFVSIIKPVAEKRGDKSARYAATYRAVYELIGFGTMNKLERSYVRKYGKNPRTRTEIFRQSNRAMKIFKDAVHQLDVASA